MQVETLVYTTSLDSMWGLFAPFEWPLWCSILAMVHMMPGCDIRTHAVHVGHGVITMAVKESFNQTQRLSTRTCMPLLLA